MYPTIETVIEGRNIARAEVLRWEDRRITAAAKKIGVHIPAGDETAMRRDALLREKLALGPDRLAARLKRETRAAEIVARAGARLSARRQISVIDLHVHDSSAAQFVTAFERWTTTSDEAAMLRACPDHFVIRTRADGTQEVLETNGGSPLAALFFIDYKDITSLVTPADSSFPHQIAGVARSSDGIAIGGVRHQFRDTQNGFHARLTVEFPLPTIGRMISGHRWHLACEFSNWIEAASR